MNYVCLWKTAVLFHPKQSWGLMVLGPMQMTHGGRSSEPRRRGAGTGPVMWLPATVAAARFCAGDDDSFSVGGRACLRLPFGGFPSWGRSVPCPSAQRCMGSSGAWTVMHVSFMAACEEGNDQLLTQESRAVWLGLAVGWREAKGTLSLLLQEPPDGWQFATSATHGFAGTGGVMLQAGAEPCLPAGSWSCRIDGS